ncbi:hypothetical protein [Pseudoalteromonas sp. HF66]|uniref:hypothetical protein n=1 Tax=Pseudoalteromonas sp. HF66 TaxID=2721559 RepID=UPI001C37D187|nr:hypothetical protein [Pseudoalteromonas sp. HF66]
MAVTQYFTSISIMSPSNIPTHWEHLIGTLRLFKLPPKKNNRYPRAIKPKPSKYPHKKEMPVSLTDWHWPIVPFRLLETPSITEYVENGSFYETY